MLLLIMYIPPSIIIKLLGHIEAQRLAIIDFSTSNIVDTLESFSDLGILWTRLNPLLYSWLSWPTIYLREDLTLMLDLLPANRK